MSPERLVELFLAAMGGGTLTALVSFYRARAQNSLDQAQAWKTLTEQLQNRLLQMQIEVDDLKIELAEKDGYIDKLCGLLYRAGVEIPIFTIRHRHRGNEDKKA